MREKYGLRFTAVKERKERRLRVKLSSKSLHTPVKNEQEKKRIPVRSRGKWLNIFTIH